MAAILQEVALAKCIERVRRNMRAILMRPIFLKRRSEVRIPLDTTVNSQRGTVRLREGTVSTLRYYVRLVHEDLRVLRLPGLPRAVPGL